jgi:hypothetical protein
MVEVESEGIEGYLVLEVSPPSRQRKDFSYYYLNPNFVVYCHPFRYLLFVLWIQWCGIR